MKLSLKNKLSFSIISVILFFGSLSVIFVFFQFKNRLVLQAKQELQSVSYAEANGIAAIFQSGSNLVENIAKDETIVQYMRIKKASPIIAKPIMFDYIGGQVEMSDGATYRRLIRYNIGNHYSAIYLISIDGTTFVSTDESFNNQNYSFRDYFKKAINGEPWIEVAIGVTSKKAGYYFSYPIRDTNGDVIGVAVVKMLPDYIHQFIIDNNMTGDQVVMFTNRNGLIIYSNDKTRIYKSLGPLDENELNLIKEKRNFNDIDIQPLDYDEVQSNLNQIDSYQTFDIKDEIDKKAEIVGAVKIKNLPFYLVIERGLEQFINPSVNVSYFLSFFVFFMMLSSIIVIIYFVNRVLLPLQNLKNGAYQLSKENFDYKLNIKTGDELEELGTTFNQMSDKLEMSYRNLNRQIEKLKKLNKLMVGREKKMSELKKQLHKDSE